MCSAWDNAALPALGFPIRASAGHRLFSASPRLIAAVHALHRLLVPRHPPCALTILTVIEPHPRMHPVGGTGGLRFGDTRYCSRAYRCGCMWLLCSFQGPRRGGSRRCVRGDPSRAAPAHGRRSLKTQQHAGWRSDRDDRTRPPGSVDMLGPAFVATGKPMTREGRGT